MAPCDGWSADPAAADDLPRHGIAGLVVAPADSSKSSYRQANPPTVQTVVKGGAGEAAGLQTGGAIVELDGKPVANSAGFALEVGRHLEGAMRGAGSPAMARVPFKICAMRFGAQ